MARLNAARRVATRRTQTYGRMAGTEFATGGKRTVRSLRAAGGMSAKKENK